MAEVMDSTPSKSSRAWVVLVVCTVLTTMAYGLMFSYSVYFKPLASHFGWDRAQTSSVYSIALLTRGLFAISVGWLADKFGARVLLIVGGVVTFIGFALSSRVQTLPQLFFTYGVVLAIGLSAIFGISTSLVAKWFTKKSGLALGIVSMGSGLGTLIVVPLSAWLINTYAWSTTFVISGAAGGLIMVVGALLIREAPKSEEKNLKGPIQTPRSLSFGEALRCPELFLISIIMFCLVFCAQVIMIHFVNYATDLGITPLKAAGIISIIGLVSMAGRLITGFAGDKIDILDLLLIAPLVTLISFLILIFFKSLTALYIFAVIYAIGYGAEVPLVPMVVKRYFGTKSMAALVGVFLFAGGVGGAAGPFVAGKIFDMTHSYQATFIVGTVILALCLIPIAMLRARSGRSRQPDRRSALVS